MISGILGMGKSNLLMIGAMSLVRLLIGWMFVYKYFRKRRLRSESQPTREHGRRIWED